MRGTICLTGGVVNRKMTGSRFFCIVPGWLGLARPDRQRDQPARALAVVLPNEAKYCEKSVFYGENEPALRKIRESYRRHDGRAIAAGGRAMSSVRHKIRLIWG
jgi:hypothetical protein